MKFILSNLGSRFRRLGEVSSSGTGKGRLVERLEAAKEVIMGWGAKAQGLLFSGGCKSTYLAAVDDVLKAVEELGEAGDGGEMLVRAESVLQMAMSKLEDQFRHVLISNAAALDADAVYESLHRLSYSFESDSDCSVEFQNSAGEEKGEDDGIQIRASMGVAVELMNPIRVNDLKDIADRMIRAGFEKELCQVYTSVRREAVDKCLTLLGVEKLGIEQVQMIEWRALDEKMKRWNQAFKAAVKVVLAGEKHLCEQVFAGSKPVEIKCFGEISKGCVMQLIIFPEAVRVGRRAPEKLFRILEMYHALSDALPDLRVILCDDSRELICSEVEVILGSLGVAAKETFVEFENAVKGETSRQPTLGGDIHPWTCSVMKYVRLLVDYSDTLNRLFDDNDGHSRAGDGSLLSHRLLLILSSLETSLEEKSKFYDDIAMRHVFVMNNIHYIVQKVKGSELEKLLGDQWIRSRGKEIGECATCYLRSGWSKVLDCISEDGLGSIGRNPSSKVKMALREKFKNFNLCFEEIYKIQTGWKVPDPQLREEMRISILENVILAYRTFMERYRKHVESGRNGTKYVKYTGDDLENYLLDFFEGNPATLNHPRRKAVG